MRRILFLSILMLLLISTASSLMAQDECSSFALNRQIDSWYQEFLGSRSEVDTQETMVAAAQLQNRIDTLLESCGLILDNPLESAEQTGMGTLDSPFDIGASATIGDVEIKVTHDIWPADEILVNDGVLPANQPDNTHYIIVYIEFSCARNAQDGGCNLTADTLRLVGDMGEVYLPAIARISDYVIETRDVPAGRQRSGGIPFLVDSDDTGLLLLYYASGDPEDEEVAYFYGQAAPTSIQVTSNVQSVAVRLVPSTISGPIGSFNDDEVGLAVAISEDGEWIFIETSRIEGWVPLDKLNIGLHIEGLVVRVEE